VAPDPAGLGGERCVGAPVKRTEDPRLLRGQGTYLDDVRVPGLLHAAFVRSPHAHALVGPVHVGAARAVLGVVAVLSGRDIAGRVKPLSPRLEAPGFASTACAALAEARVRFVGEPVAVVAARSAAVAADAAELVEVEYEPLPPVVDVDAALAPGAPRLHPDLPDNILIERRHRSGDVDAAMSRAALVTRETFRHARCSATPLEPRGLIAAWTDEALTVWTGTQAPYIYRAALAEAFSLAEPRVRVMVCDTGGGFGQKMHVLAEDLAVVALAWATGRPVKWVESRRENLAAAAQAREARVEIEAGADAEGRLLALRARVLSDVGAYHIHPLTAALEPLGTASILPGPYRVPAYAWEAAAVATNKPASGAYRGVGMTMGAFVMERTLDLLAARLGLDPAEIRRRNLIGPGDYPFTSASGLVYDSGDFPRALEQALTLARYDERRRWQARAREAGRCVGVGVACYTEYTGMGAETYRRRGMALIPGGEAAALSVAPDGGVICALSFPSQGQGHATTAAQIAADGLGVPLDQVRVVQPDTDVAPAGSGTFASRGAVAQAVTVERAARRLRDRALAIAGTLLEAAPVDLELTGGRARVRGMPTRSVSLADIARAVAAAPGAQDGQEATLRVTESADLPGPVFSGAVHVAWVEVDPETGRVSVLGYVVAEDCGRVINPMIVEGQIHGALAQGIGEALRERLLYDETGQLLTGTLMDYGLVGAGDLPSFTIGHLETPSPLAPGGYKGMGEGGTIGAPAAIANAVADALRPLGIPVTSLPLVPEILIRLGPADR
jgi:carbon-monoxide dehydrogenase large subunit